MSVLELEPDVLEIEAKLSKDIKASAKLLGRRQARYLVDMYYQMQDARIRADGQVRSGDSGEPNGLLQWNADNFRRMEARYKSALGIFANEYIVGRWLQSICGIGPVISAGLISHLKMQVWACHEFQTTHKCKPCTQEEPHGPQCMNRDVKTAGHFWNFAGLNSEQEWKKGHYRPWNTDLKTLSVFKLGESFVKVQANKNDYYGKLFRARRDEEGAKDAALAFKELAAERVETVGKTTEARKYYESGHLPPAHLHARARRWTVKIFLSHLHHVMHVDFFGADPCKPYVFEKCPGDHRHFIPIPHWPYSGGGKSLKDLHA